MMQTFQESIQVSSEDSPSSNSIQVIHHFFNNVLKIIEVERASFPKWMDYMHYHNINELCDDPQFELEYIHHYSDYIVNRQQCELKFSTMATQGCSLVGCQPERKKTHFNFLLKIFFPLHIRISISSSKKT